MILIDSSGLYECKASTTQCQTIRDGFVKAYDALGKMDKDSNEYKKLKRALDSYGCDSSDEACGKKGLNGVTINVRKRGGADTSTEGEINKKTAANPTGQDIRVDFGIDTLTNTSESGSYYLIGSIAHEGSHVADGSEWVKSGFLASKNPTLYQGEKDAFFVMSYVQQQLGTYGSVYTFKDKKAPSGYVEFETWNYSWRNVDKERLRNIDGIIKYDYKVTPTKPGAKTLIKGSKFPK
jgi:hypothetical protein